MYKFSRSRCRLLCIDQTIGHGNVCLQRNRNKIGVNIFVNRLCDQDAYYWISIAAEATGNSMMKERYDQMAREELPEEEYQKVQHLLEIRTHKEE